MRIGILGAAQIARHSVAGPASRMADIELVAVAARDPGRADAFAREHGVRHVCPNYDAVLARTDIDLVYVPLVNAEHARWSIAALRAGHHVLCEKPMAMIAADAEAMVAASIAVDRLLIEGFHYRHHALMHWLIGEVRSGWLGEIRQVSGHFVAALPRVETRWDARLGGGALFDLGCYPLHALRTLFGEPQIIGATARWHGGIDATLQADLRFGTVPGRIECSLEADQRSAGLTIEGAKGSIMIDNFVAPQLPHRVVTRRDGREETRSFAGPGSFDAQLMHVGDVLAGVAVPVTGGVDAIGNAAAIDTILAAARGKEA